MWFGKLIPCTQNLNLLKHFSETWGRCFCSGFPVAEKNQGRTSRGLGKALLEVRSRVVLLNPTSSSSSLSFNLSNSDQVLTTNCSPSTVKRDPMNLLLLYYSTGVPYRQKSGRGTSGSPIARNAPASTEMVSEEVERVSLRDWDSGFRVYVVRGLGWRGRGLSFSLGCGGFRV